MGAAAVLFSNKAESWRERVKYSLETTTRIHLGQSEDAYRAIYYGPDAEGINGIYLGKNVVTEASRALTKALWTVGPKILTVRQKAEFAVNWVQRQMYGDKVPSYVPKFNQSVEHFMIHAGGAKVLDGIGKALSLTEEDLKPSRAVLWNFGNVSSSTTWYTLANLESVKGVCSGDKLVQIGVGSGIKCGVNIWKREISQTLA
eukprot:gene15298-21383_t